MVHLRFWARRLAKYWVQRFLSSSKVKRICEEATIICRAPSTTCHCCIAASFTSRLSSARACLSSEARRSIAL